MCMNCDRFWTALQTLWSLTYVTFGAIQLMAGIFFIISIPDLHLYSILFAGSWNIIIGICGGIVACVGVISKRRQEILLYMAISILTVNCVNIVLVEYLFYVIDMEKLASSYLNNHELIDYACLVARIATGALLAVSFIDSQLLYCSMQSRSLSKRKKGKKMGGSHEQVSDIEYIIPRPKNNKSNTHTVYDAYAQSWVFEGNNENNNFTNAETDTYFALRQNGATPKTSNNSNEVIQNGHIVENPVVHVEEASDDSTSNSDRKLCYMKSFSRSQSPMVLSASSSQLSLNSPHHQPIYDCLEKLTEASIYRSRLDTALSNDLKSPLQYQTPTSIKKEVVSSPKVEYASLMKELQKKIVCKKEVSSSSSNSSHSPGKSEISADFSKELEAALQLIQDLESPNTPSETKSPSDVKNVSLQELNNGKINSQSTSGYSSPTTSSITGSNPDIVKTTPAFTIYNNEKSTVISLYSQPSTNKPKQVTLVQITGDDAQSQYLNESKIGDKSGIKEKSFSLQNGWKLNSLLRKKKVNTLPKLAPELEGAIIKSESLAYLTDVELLERHQRNQELQREIEKKVFRQLGTRTESNC